MKGNRNMGTRIRGVGRKVEKTDKGQESAAEPLLPGEAFCGLG
jgi:hypothetical protein